MRVKAPPRGFVPSAPCWNPNVLSSLLQNQPKPTPRAATIFRSAGRDLRNKRSPRLAERSACRAITRGSGGEQPTHIYSIPTSAVWGVDPSAGQRTHNCLVRCPTSYPVLDLTAALYASQCFRNISSSCFLLFYSVEGLQMPLFFLNLLCRCSFSPISDTVKTN